MCVCMCVCVDKIAVTTQLFAIYPTFLSICSNELKWTIQDYYFKHCTTAEDTAEDVGCRKWAFFHFEMDEKC